MTDTLVRNAGPTIPDVYMVTADQETILGNGTTENPLRAASAATEGRLIGRQVFDAAGSGTYVPTAGTRRVVVRGCGGGGGGGGIGATNGSSAAGAAGGNSGSAVEQEFVAAGDLLTGGAFTVGAGGAGGVGSISGGIGTQGGDSTIEIEGDTLTARGGTGGAGSTAGASAPSILGPFSQPINADADYQSADLGGPGWTLAVPASASLAIGGAGGSGSFGIGGRGAGGGNALGVGRDADGSGAGGGGAAISINTAATDGGDGSPGIWIVEEYA